MSQSEKSEVTTSALWGGRFGEATDAFVQRFTASQHFDRLLAPQDIRGSLAHARMLAAQDILSAEDLTEIEAGLATIAEEIDQGRFDWRVDREDVHMNIAARLTEIIGEAG